MKQSQFETATFCYMEQLFRLAYSRTGNALDAEDIVQETYLKAYRAFTNLRQHESVKSWLTHILINTINDYRRKEMRTVPTVDISEMEVGLLQEPTQLSPEEQICQDEIDPALSKALQQLPELFLTPLLLREIEGATYSEIAQLLDIPLGTVMSRLSRARALLRNALTSEQTQNKTDICTFPVGLKSKEARSNELP